MWEAFKYALKIRKLRKIEEKIIKLTSKREKIKIKQKSLSTKHELLSKD